MNPCEVNTWRVSAEYIVSSVQTDESSFLRFTCMGDARSTHLRGSFIGFVIPVNVALVGYAESFESIVQRSEVR